MTRRVTVRYVVTHISKRSITVDVDDLPDWLAERAVGEPSSLGVGEHLTDADTVAYLLAAEHPDYIGIEEVVRVLDLDADGPIMVVAPPVPASGVTIDAEPYLGDLAERVDWRAGLRAEFTEEE